MRDTKASGFVRLRGGREHDLEYVDVDMPRDALVVFARAAGPVEPAVSPYPHPLFHPAQPSPRFRPGREPAPEEKEEA